MCLQEEITPAALVPIQCHCSNSIGTDWQNHQNPGTKQEYVKYVQVNVYTVEGEVNASECDCGVHCRERAERGDTCGSGGSIVSSLEFCHQIAGTKQEMGAMQVNVYTRERGDTCGCGACGHLNSIHTDWRNHQNPCTKQEMYTGECVHYRERGVTPVAIHNWQNHQIAGTKQEMGASDCVHCRGRER